MPITLEHVQGFLDEFDLNYQVDEERDAVLIGFGIDPERSSYRNRQGEPGIQFVIRVMEDGDFLSIFAPQAWNVADCQHRGVVFEAIASIQSTYKLLRFDYDPADGEIRPNVELPVEDTCVTSHQFHRLMHCIYLGVQRFDTVIRHAMNTGEVSFASLKDDEPATPPSPAVVRLQALAEEAGSIDALERIACGCDVEHEAGDSVIENPLPPSSASPASEAGPSERPKPAIRRIWEHLFGTDKDDHSGEGDTRRAG